MPDKTENEMMQAAGFDWNPTYAGYPRWIQYSKDIYCIRRPDMTDEQWEERKRRVIVESQLNMSPSFFAQLGQPCCSRWMSSEYEWIALAYVQALANDGDVWKQLTREQTYSLLTQSQQIIANSVLTSEYYASAFRVVSKSITCSDAAFRVGDSGTGVEHEEPTQRLTRIPTRSVVLDHACSRIHSRNDQRVQIT